MKPAAPSSGAFRKLARGAAAVELAVLLSATIVLMPAVALFAKVFFQYSVMKEATRDAAAYLASLPPAAVKDDTERARAIVIAQRMVQDAAAGASMSGTTTVEPAYVECDNHSCAGQVPDLFGVTVTFTIDDAIFNGLTGRWTDYENSTWEVTARSTVPFTK
ncbi:MAG TPA: TadE family protein [Telluria sp.]|jgi:Flp pilus assembly protein TadG|nr:TadE family protein [Telluria sp.]